MIGYDAQILEVLEGEGGFTTGDIAERVGPVFGHNKRTHSGFIRTRLLAMQNAGLVRPMDDMKPVVWVRHISGKGKA